MSKKVIAIFYLLTLSMSIFCQTSNLLGSYVQRSWENGYRNLLLKENNLFQLYVATDYGYSANYFGEFEQDEDTLILRFDFSKTKIDSISIDSSYASISNELRYYSKRNKLYELLSGNRINKNNYFIKKLQ